MKKTVAYMCAIAISLVMCGIVIFVPMGGQTVWQTPCVNLYSLFAAAFFVMNTIGLCIFARGVNIFAKPYTQERAVIEKKKNHVISVVLAFFEVPLLLTVFFIDSGWKMVVCSALFIGGSMILGSIIGEISVGKLRKEFKALEQRELAEQLQKEEG